MTLMASRVESIDGTKYGVVLEAERLFAAERVAESCPRLELPLVPAVGADATLERRIDDQLQPPDILPNDWRDLVGPTTLGESGSGVADFLRDAEIEWKTPGARENGSDPCAASDILNAGTGALSPLTSE